MKIIEITKSYTAGLSEIDIYDQIVEQEGKIIVDYLLSHIHSTQSHLDIMQNYLEASFIAETLGSLATTIEYQEMYVSQYHPTSRLTVTTQDAKALSKKIYELSIAFSDEQEDEDVYIDLLGDLEEYTETMDYRTFFCAEPVDSYYANLVNGGYYEIESESEDLFLEREFTKYPERKFRFWRSAYSNTIGDTFYVSSDSWIVPSKIDIYSLLTAYSGLSPVDDCEEATLFTVDSYSYLINNHSLVYFPFGPFFCC